MFCQSVLVGMSDITVVLNEIVDSFKWQTSSKTFVTGILRDVIDAMCVNEGW